MRHRFVLTLVVALVAHAMAGTSVMTANEPSPSAVVLPSSAPPASVEPRPWLAASLPDPSGRPSVERIDRAADAFTTRHGVLLELWAPGEPIVSGGWAGATVRVTNLGRSAIHFSEDIGDWSCGPVSIRLPLGPLFGDVVPHSGNARLFADAVMDSVGTRRMVTYLPDGSHPCADYAKEGTLGPGASFRLRVAAPAIDQWRAQPLPSGTTIIRAELQFWRSGPGGNETQRRGLVVDAPIRVSGPEVQRAGPAATVESMLAVPAFVAWLATRDLTTDWNLTMSLSPGLSEDAQPFLGGSAPEDRMTIGLSAEGSAPGSLWSFEIDPWTGTVISSELLG